VKALRDLGVLLVLFLGMLWLAASPEAPQQPESNGVVAAAQLEMPPVPDALIEQLPALKLPVRSQALSIQLWNGHSAQLSAHFLQGLSAPDNWQQVRLHGRLQQLQQHRLYPFHEFG